ncbi:gamma-glutamylcyclotransferase family protein [Methylophaga sp.]|uniref:gamma-glutamylcyclotransferase family protein n=1 Tax=Methylophaga sp. TaxID=2024840 RepID=UPI0014014DE2|nr:gamma-glutamylcyclotransferase family protein [Methylophaga sp.]MTI62437.1 gamma-glutamylcyclotransferase [Methylophaga sp.]
MSEAGQKGQTAQRGKVLYFAYGSNMSSRRLQARVPSAEVYARAVLQGHQLRFHKHSLVDDSAKCDAYQTGNPDDLTRGVLFLFDAEEQAELDMCEGEGYKVVQVEVETEDGQRLEALTYLAVLLEPGLSPYPWYKRHVLEGAREHMLPAEYIAWIESVVTQEDRNRERCERELAIYR